jgi:hypothetical protein
MSGLSPIRKLSRNGVLDIEVMDRNKHQNTTADYCFLNDNVSIVSKVNRLPKVRIPESSPPEAPVAAMENTPYTQLVDAN